ncbi:hypothetical protein H5410_056329 [Solanum commersonii]|uniref:Uncharacterized protein n=1 Tax=Solanum commersonii TaxID=4109 RepID=A0A9J5WJZ3_SOLCO|nr:hypothetical protein H5410_056329 [Solanum commersonii]
MFQFSDFEMTPTLEDIASFMGKGSNIRGADLHNKRLIVPKNIDAKKFLDLLKINQIEKESLKKWWVSLDFLYKRFTLDWCNYVSSHKEREEKIDFPKGILACEEKLSVITSDEIVWNYYWFPAKYVICMSTGISFLVLIGLRCVQPYAPPRVMHQLARVQEIQPNDDMSRFVFDTLTGFSFNRDDILKIWYGSIISEQSEIVVEQDKGKVVPGYLSWFRDLVTFSDTLEGSSRERKDQHIIRQLEKELEKAKSTISR